MRCCSGCGDELREECKTQKNEAHLIARCLSGPLLVMIEDDKDDLPALLKDDKDEKDPEFEEGDHKSEPPPLSLSSSQRPSSRIVNLSDPSFQTTFVSSMTSSPKNPSMCCQSPNRGTMLLRLWRSNAYSSTVAQVVH